MTALPSGFTNFNSPIKYAIDGNDLFTVFGVIVANSRGILNAPSRKQPFAQSWPDGHGEAVDTSAVYYDAKEFSLDCWMMGTSNLDITEKINLLYNELSKPGLRRLMLFLNEDKPLIYQVYIKGEIDIKKKWKVGQLMHCDFSITFREPEPLKVILTGYVSDDSHEVGIMLTCTKPVNIRWGHTMNGDSGEYGINPDYIDIVGVNQIYAQHFRVTIGQVFPVLSGAVETITNLQLTNLTVLWNKLL